MPSEAHPLRDETLTALRSLRYPAKLRTSPLFNNSAVRAGLTNSSSEPSSDDLALALCHKLEAIIDDLRPGGDENLKQRDWLRYYLLCYLFQQGKSPLSVQRILGISRSFFYQLRNEAVDSVATLLAAMARSTVISLTEPIPSAPDFVGRDAELALYRRHLASHNLAIIHGFAGTGKTALAAQLASERQRANQPVIWITFYPGINVDLDKFLETLACALDELGYNDLRDLLCAQRSHPYPLDTRIQYAVNCLSAHQVTLCLDDAHLVEDVSGLQRFFSSLVPRQQPARTSLIVASRDEPAFVRGRCIAPLPGMNDRDARRLLNNAGLGWLEDEDLIQLQQHVEGNVAFLKFFIAWAQAEGVVGLPPAERTARTHRFIRQIGRSPTSHSFLLHEILATLDSTERSVLERVALCHRPLNLEDAATITLFADFDPNQISATLLRLQRRNLLICRGDGTTCCTHALVRNYLLAQLELAPDRRAVLHGLLSCYYAETDDVSEIAFHSCQAGNSFAAAKLFGRRAKGLVRNGRGINKGSPP